MEIVNRKIDIAFVQSLIANFPVTAILGARQCGKTTLARLLPYNHYFDLENPRDLAQLEQPLLALENLEGLIVIDEIQRRPDIFPPIRYLVDHALPANKPKQKYLVLGSASPDLLRQSSESLAGRIAYYHLGGFRLEDVGESAIQQLWLRGGLPPSFLASSDDISKLWRDNYIMTFLERDIPQLGLNIPARSLHRFWTMVSYLHGQVVNYAELGRSFGMSDMSVRRYLEILESTFMVRILLPWQVNIGKRLVKRPKVYLRDSGILHALLAIDNHQQLLGHYKLGASWEGFALETVCQLPILHGNQFYYYRTHAGAELDLYWPNGDKAWGIEFKYQDSPSITRSIHNVMQDLHLEHLWIVYPGHQQYALTAKVNVVPLAMIGEVLEKMFNET